MTPVHFNISTPTQVLLILSSEPNAAEYSGRLAVWKCFRNA